MRRVYGIILLVMIVSTLQAVAYDITVRVVNPVVIGTDVVYDVYIQNTGVDDVRLTESVYVWNYNKFKFTNPAASVNSPLNSNYDPYADIVFNDELIIFDIPHDVGSPSTSNTLEIAKTNPGTRLGTVTVTNISDFLGEMDLDWEPGFGGTLVFVYDPALDKEEEANITLAPIETIKVGPHYDGIIKRQELLSNTYSFDVYLKHTGGPAFFLDNSDLVVRIPDLATKFTAPTVDADFGTMRLDDNYSVTANIAGDEVQITIDGPAVADQAEFDSKVEQIGAADCGTKIVSISITGANGGQTVFDIDPNWDFAFPGETQIRRRRPLNFSDNITDPPNGTFSVVAPQFSIEVLRPNGGENFCQGTLETIEWDSENIATVDITLLSAGVTSATIATGVSGPGGSYDWNIPGGQAPGQYSIRVSDASNGNRFDDSDSEFTIVAPPTITAQPQSTSACTGLNVNLNVTATGTGLAYQWKKNGNPLPGETAATLMLTSVTTGNTGDYTVMVSNLCGSIESATAAVMVLTPPAITMQPQDLTVTELETATFAVVAGGSNLTYQWQFSTDGNVFAPLPGATAATLNIPNVQLNQAGLYRVVVSGVCPPAVTSTAAALTVIPLFTTFNVTAYMEGYWRGTHHRLTPVAIELRTGPELETSATVGLQTGMLSSTGTISAEFPALPDGDYWLIVRHGGHFPVASSGRLSVNAGDSIDYNFTDASDRAFGGTGVTVEFENSGAFMQRAGDLNGDQTVSADDFIEHFVPNFGLSNPGRVPRLEID